MKTPEEIAVTAVQILRPRKRDVLVFKIEGGLPEAELTRLREAFRNHLDFTPLILCLGPDDDIGVLRYEDAAKEAERER